MATQDTSSVGLSYGVEDPAAYGVQPAGNFQNVRMTSEDFSQEQETQESDEINSDRQPASPARVDFFAQGGFGFEMSYGSHDEFIRAVYSQNAFPTAIDFTEADLSLAAGDNSLNTAGAIDFTAENIVVGGWLGIRGFAQGDIYARVVSVTAAKIVLSHATVVTEAAGPSVQVQGQTIYTGTDKEAFTFEKRYLDTTPDVFFRYRGMRCGTMQLNVQTKSKVTGSFAFRGIREELQETAPWAPGYDAAPTGEVVDTVTGIKAVLEGGVAIGLTSEVRFTIENNLRAKAALGVLGAFDVGLGTVRPTGNLRAYFQDKALLEKATNFETSSLALVLEFSDGSAQVYDFPSVKYTRGTAPTPGNNQDVFVSLDFAAFKDATLAQTASFTRIPA